ncbi:translation elongation factor Ts [Desulfovibrio sp. An276]|uniref:translation elongation factor Ts n=1 Tax=Desulfovibrio sp. An276 TaxID=1965618 RepID=UPI000B38BD61|nr:translation elongation factor Ts [Desulfovibrio sp. An276]OUO51508.1 translation elongation factor Ts [Desulfovibrio sp. An276]
MAITAAMVKDLRERTGAGMMDCKKALVEVGGDMEKAVDYLREKGMAKAAKKAGRATSEGLVVFAENADATRVAMASLQCETDFVSRGDDFKDLAARVVNAVLENKPADAEALQGLVGEDVNNLIAKIGENMRLGKFYVYDRAANEVVGQYLHTASGKLGVMVVLEVGKPETAANEQVQNLAREIAMQVAALRPMALDRASLAPEVIERERNVYREKARNDGKPEQIIEKIAEGAVVKFCKEVCLLDQPYIRDDKKSISDFVRETGKAVGDTITVKSFERIELVAEEAPAEAAE